MSYLDSPQFIVINHRYNVIEFTSVQGDCLMILRIIEAISSIWGKILYAALEKYL